MQNFTVCIIQVWTLVWKIVKIKHLCHWCYEERSWDEVEHSVSFRTCPCSKQSVISVLIKLYQPMMCRKQRVLIKETASTAQVSLLLSLGNKRLLLLLLLILPLLLAGTVSDWLLLDIKSVQCSHNEDIKKYLIGCHRTQKMFNVHII